MRALSERPSARRRGFRSFTRLCQTKAVKRKSEGLFTGDDEPADQSTGKLTWKVLPCPGTESIQMRPPMFSTIFLHTAKPMPVPSHSLDGTRRWKILNTLSRSASAMPRPLSATQIRHTNRHAGTPPGPGGDDRGCDISRRCRSDSGTDAPRRPYARTRSARSRRQRLPRLARR